MIHENTNDTAQNIHKILESTHANKPQTLLLIQFKCQKQRCNKANTNAHEKTTGEEAAEVKFMSLFSSIKAITLVGVPVLSLNFGAPKTIVVFLGGMLSRLARYSTSTPSLDCSNTWQS